MSLDKLFIFSISEYEIVSFTFFVRQLSFGRGVLGIEEISVGAIRDDSSHGLLLRLG